MSSNTPAGVLASQVASDEAASIRRKVAEKCQIVLETLYDSYNGYKQCAADCKDSTVQLLFQRIAASRFDLITQLSNVIEVDLGVQPYVIYLCKTYIYIYFCFSMFQNNNRLSYCSCSSNMDRC